MHPALAALFIVGGLLSVAFGVVVGVFYPHTEGPQPYSLVYSETGKYSYIQQWGDLAPEYFDTKEAAQKALDEHRQWYADYQAGKFAFETAKREQFEASFKPLK